MSDGQALERTGDGVVFPRPQDIAARDLCRRLATEIVEPIARQADVDRVFPAAAVRSLAKEGILGAALPESRGGLGWDALQLSHLYEEFGRVDQSVRGFLSVHLGLVSQCLHEFAADHQAAHVYVKDPGKVAGVAELLRGVSGVEHVLDRPEQARLGVAHGRSGDLVLAAEARHWFNYAYWLDDARAPDFATS